MNILVNLPESFFRVAELEPIFHRLHALGGVRFRSHNTADEIRGDLAWAEAIIMWSWPVLTDELLDMTPQLRYVGHLDVSQKGAQIALQRGLPISVSRQGFSPAVSEMALTLALSTLRRVSDYHAQMRAGAEQWVQQFPIEIDPLERELSGRPVGIVGFGNVGRGLARLLAPFHCELRIVDPFVPEEVVQQFGAQRVSLQEMIRESDVVVLCAASNAGTRYLIGVDEMALFRPNAVFINVARAALVNTNALVERLRRGDLFAAIDVFDHEPLEHDAALRVLPNAYLTPHRAGGLMSSVQRILTWLVDDLEAVIAGRPRAYPVTEAMIPSLDA
jgi:phosphoglycerate dehydrogenase-like enzyme